MLCLPRPTLLLVEDYPEIRRALRRNLENDFVCMEACTGREAAAIVATRPVDVVVLDVKLPDISGIEWLSRYVRADPRRRVVTISGFLDEEIGKVALSVGAAKHLMKPFTAQTLHAAIDSVLAPARAS